MKNTLPHKTAVVKAENCQFYAEITGTGEPIICLHGFSEDQTTWKYLNLPAYSLIKIDLIGHGKSDRPNDPQCYCPEVMLRQLHIVINRLVNTKYIMLGYSMGGRIGLAYTLRYQQEVRKLILESASIGIQNDDERKERYQSEKMLADNILTKGIPWFQQHWSALPIFETQKKLPADVAAEIKQRRLNNSGTALAHTLMGSGQGSCPYYGDRLAELTIPALFISGSRDQKYSYLGQQLAVRQQGIVSVSIEHAGHNVHLEQPELFQRAVKEFVEAPENTEDFMILRS